MGDKGSVESVLNEEPLHCMSNSVESTRERETAGTSASYHRDRHIFCICFTMIYNNIANTENGTKRMSAMTPICKLNSFGCMNVLKPDIL